MKVKYFWCSVKKFDVMISRLKVELEKVTPFREDPNGYRNVFTPKLPFKDIQIDMPQIKHQSLLASWLYRNGNWPVNYVRLMIQNLNTLGI